MIFTKEEVKMSASKNTQRFWEDVNEGDEIPGQTIYIDQTEIVIHVGATQNYDKVHFDREYTQAGGHADAFMHTTWYNGNFGKMLTEYIGIDGWIKKQSQQMRRMNHPGDTTTFAGKVVRKYQENDEFLLDIEMWAGNQREEVTTPARATVALPSKNGWKPGFPVPSEEYTKITPIGPASEAPNTRPRSELKTPEDFLNEAKKWIGWESESTTFTYPMEHDPIRRFCHMTKDDNPLYLDPTYAKDTRFGGVICPPSYHLTYREFWPPTEENAGKMGSPSFEFETPGDHPANLSSEEENFRPIYVGDVITSKKRYEDVYIKPLRVDPDTFWITSATIYWNQKGEIVRINRGTLVKHRTPEEVTASN